MHMARWTESVRLFAAKPLYEPMRTNSQMDIEEQTSVKFELEYTCVISKRCIWMCLQNSDIFVHTSMY